MTSLNKLNQYLSSFLQPLHQGAIEIAPAPNMGMINFLFSMGKIAIAKEKARKESPKFFEIRKSAG